MSLPTSEQALDHFIMSSVSEDMIIYLANAASSIISCNQLASGFKVEILAAPPVSSSQNLPPLKTFIRSLINRSHVEVPTLMTSLVYLSRVRERIQVRKRTPCAVHRIFLASLNLTAKVLNDRSPKNKYWACYSCVKGYEGFGFSVKDVNRMEFQLLSLLEWDLQVTKDDLFTHLEPFLAPICSPWSRMKDTSDLSRPRRSISANTCTPRNVLTTNATCRPQQHSYIYGPSSSSIIGSTARCDASHMAFSSETLDSSTYLPATGSKDYHTPFLPVTSGTQDVYTRLLEIPCQLNTSNLSARRCHLGSTGQDYHLLR